MDYSTKTRDELVALCKEKSLKGYSGKKKALLIELLSSLSASPNTPVEAENTKETVTEETKRVEDPKKHKKELGQFFTISEPLQQFVFDHVQHKSSRLLEPSFGAGHLLRKFKEYDQNYPITCYELDEKVEHVISFNEHQTVVYGDFMRQSITDKFMTIIGNPPYVKQKTGNLYIQFIERCYSYLDDQGEMIFIVPSDFIKLTRAASIIGTMTQHGGFTDFWFPHDEKLFEGASIDVVVFRYQKGVMNRATRVNGKEMFCHVHKGIITFRDTETTGLPFDSLFHVYVGLVSGKDDVYRVPFGNMDILNDKERTDKYIFADKFPTGDGPIDSHLLAHKTELLKRKIKTFSETNWFEWGAPRNISSIRTHWGQPCIYLKNMTRNKEVAFVGQVQYFGGSLLCLVPKDGVIVDLQEIVQHIHSPDFQKDYLYAGRFKIGHKQISSALLPK